MNTKSIEYLADLLQDGHLSIPDEIKRKLKRVSGKKIRVRIDLEIEKASKKNHPAFGIWSDRLSEVDSGEVAEKLRKKLEGRNDVSR